MQFSDPFLDWHLCGLASDFVCERTGLVFVMAVERATWFFSGIFVVFFDGFPESPFNETYSLKKLSVAFWRIFRVWN